MNQPKRKWKRWALLLLLLFALYYLGVFSRPLRMTRENTGLTSLPAGVDVPIRADGKGVDYVKAYEILFPQVSEITEENGWRDVVQALGMIVFSDCCFEDYFPRWLETFSQSREAYWQEYCRRLALDPAEVKTPAQPYLLPDSTMREYVHRKIETLREEVIAAKRAAREANPPKPPEDEEDMEEEEEDYADQDSMWQLLEAYAAGHGVGLMSQDVEGATEYLLLDLFFEAGWSREEFPELATWVDTYSPTLDVVAAAVRKPRYFMPFFKERDDQPLLEICTDDVSFQYPLARGLAVRATMYLHADDVEKTLADIESLWRLTQHLEQLPDAMSAYVVQSVSHHAERATRGLLAKNACTPRQWQALAAMMASLPEPSSSKNNFMFSDWLAYEFLGNMVKYEDVEETYDTGSKDLIRGPIDHVRGLLPPAPNVATRRYAQLCRMATDPAQYETLAKLDYWSQYTQFMLYITRSRTAANHLWVLFNVNKTGMYEQKQRRTQRFRMFQLAVALKCYQTQHGGYPDSLDALVPEYVATVEIAQEELPELYRMHHLPVLNPATYAKEGDGFLLYVTEEDGKPEDITRDGDYSGRYIIQVKN